MTTDSTPESRRPYPVRLTAELDTGLSRWLWLVKWLLAIPHFIVLFFLWIAFILVSIGAFFAILFSGRFPRSLFDFNVGVMRWTWRVAYYTYGALGTDRYPPFTLADVPGYPARLEIDYPQRLSRGLVLVKSWLLAVPHYLVIAFFIGAGSLAADQASDHPHPFLLGGGLVGLLVLFAAVALLFTGRYPRTIFVLVIGMQRWVVRVAGYAALMTDEYPPFRLDQGGSEDVATAAPPPGPSPASTHGSKGRTTAVVLGTLSLVLAAALLLAAVALWAAKKALPDDDGFFTAPTATCRAESSALVSEPIRLHFSGDGGWTPHSVLGDGKVTATMRDRSPVFVGIADASSVEDYLGGTAKGVTLSERDGISSHICDRVVVSSPAAAPGSVPIWTAQAEGAGSQTITWPFEEGDWRIVIMNPDRSQGLDVAVDAGATLPAINVVIVAALFIGGVFLLIGLVLLLGVATRPRGDRYSPSEGPTV